MQKKQIINFLSRQNNRNNDEVLNLDANTNGLDFRSLINANLYYTNSLSIRDGVADLSGGIVNSTGISQLIYDTVNTPIDVTGTTVSQVSAGGSFDYWGQIIIPSGDQNVISGSLTIQGDELFSQITSDDLKLNMYIYKLNQTPISQTVMSGSGFAHDISLHGNYNTPPFPNYQNNQGQITTTQLPVPNAITADVIFNLGPYTQTGSHYQTAFKTIDWSLSAPYPLQSGSTYFIQNFIQLTSGTSNRTFNIAVVQSSGNDLYPNAALGQEFFYFGGPANQSNVIRLNNGTPVNKSWLSTQLYNYVEPGTFITEVPAVSDMIGAPIINGSNLPANPDFPEAVVPFSNFVVATPTFPPQVPTNTVEFGQVVTIPSGNHVIYGGYIYANTFLSGTIESSSTVNPRATRIPFYNINGNTIDPHLYNVGYVASLSKINQTSGLTTSGTYAITDRDIVAQYSGNYIFDNPIQLNTSITLSPSNGLERIYSLFSNPVQFSGSVDEQYLFSYKFNDFNSGADLTDFGAFPVFLTGNSLLYFSPLKLGVQTSTSGNYVFNKNGDGETFKQLNLSTGSTVQYDLACGLLAVPSGNAIQGIKDYTTSVFSQRVVYGQGGTLREFDINKPAKENHVTLFTGGSPNTDAIWSFEIASNMLFATQYSTTGTQQSWNQVNFNNSGNSTFHWGLRPTIGSITNIQGSGNPVNISGVITPGTGTTDGGFATGNIWNVKLATQMNSGGFRSSITYTGITTINNSYLHISGLNISGQYVVGTGNLPYDLAPNSTTIFVNQANTYFTNSGTFGNTSGTSTPVALYQAVLVDAPYPSGNVIPQPISNSLNECYIQRPALGIDNGVSLSLNDFDQNYLDTQIEVPNGKFIINYYNYLLVAGAQDEGAKIYYSGILQPQIYGEGQDFSPSFITMPNNTQPITGMAKLRQYLIVFQKGITSRIEFTGNDSAPFIITELSSTIGSLGLFGVVSIGDIIYFLSQFGVASCNGNTCQVISDAITPYYSKLDKNQLEFAYGVLNQNEKTINWSISNNIQSETNNFGILFNYEFSNFSVRAGGLWNVEGTIKDQFGFDILVIGTALGELKVLNSGIVDQDTLFLDNQGNSLSTNIQLYAELPFNALDDSKLMKTYNFIEFNTTNAPGTILQFDVYFDNNDTLKRYTRQVVLEGNNPDKRIYLGGKGRNIKIAFYTVGLPNQLKINSMNIYYNTDGVYNSM